MNPTKEILLQQIEILSIKLINAIEISSHNEIIEKLENYNIQINNIKNIIQLIEQEQEQNDDIKLQVYLFFICCFIYLFAHFFLYFFASLFVFPSLF